MTEIKTEPIAVVGSGCRFPGGANSASSLWTLIQSPPDLLREINHDRFSAAGFYHPDGARLGRSNVRHSYLLDEDIRTFDAPFFNISANEAEAIDPQQRILLETVYEALEAGGHTMESLRGSDTSVYVGTMTVDYHDTLLRDHNNIPKYFATGSNRAIISNRVSYFFDWHGPSMTIDTACSSSLIAVHQGVQSLRSGESQVSVACGTQVLLGYDMYISESNLKMLSPNGRSRMWDADADGYARGEGVAAIVMKRLSDAISNGDHIECIIRETGANQDGFSNGITVPSSEWQANLIRQTYAKAGLDPQSNPADRPQYFEAHGTGTQAGDPKEAEAIFNLFANHPRPAEEIPLYVGSIKTVIGHLEGAAGLAGFLKASLSLQHGMITPNLSFYRLNPNIEPFYKNLEVPVHLKKWPKLPRGVPRRASVNSFGFGGANAHAILEQHIVPPSEYASDGEATINMAPFLFSALTESSLVSVLKQYLQVFKERADDMDLSDLAWTLERRRSQLSTRIAFSASTIQELIDKIDKKLALVAKNAGNIVGYRSRGKVSSLAVLGVFTGQGAQWPAMGACLIRSSSFVKDKIDQLEDSLASLPPLDRPTWSLREEMLAAHDASRVSEAALSQPLCTAVQIILVDLLRTAGTTFSAVVGHSSGEIAAAYAAGMLSATDAIRIAYYRGLYARLAGNASNGQKGGMLAAGISWGEAAQLVSSVSFTGRLAIAAHNSSASVTLSGDVDAIAEAKALLDEQRIFARLLKVDTAYHSHHMLASGDAYVAALKACHIRVGQPRDNCKWYSSVVPNEEPMGPTEELQSTYWKDNLTGSVLFADAVKNAVTSNEHLDLAIEVGPHPALKGPTTQNMGDVRSTPLPYTGLLKRGINDVNALSDSLGFVWTLFGSKAVDLDSFRQATSGQRRSPRLIRDLPAYQWDHGRIHWTESRRSRKIRGQLERPHELLGTPSPESNSRDMRWTNILRTSNIPWMEGHRLQGLTVFPAAGYVTMAIEAGRKVAGNRGVQLYEVRNLLIPKAVVFADEETSGVETLVTLSNIHKVPDQAVQADFAIYSAASVSTGPDHDMELVASATLRIVLGDAHLEALPCSATMDDYNMTDIDSDRAYDVFTKLGYGYTGAFRGLSSIKRRLNHASAFIDTYVYADDEDTVYLVHPSTLDVAIQSSMLAYSCPGDERLWTLHVPTRIGLVRINPDVCRAVPTSVSKLPIFATLDQDAQEFSASISIYLGEAQKGMVEVEELILQPFAPATAAEDRGMFLSTKLGIAAPDAAAHMENLSEQPSSEEMGLATVCERVAYYYLGQWTTHIAAEDWVRQGSPHLMQLRDFAVHTVARVSRGEHPTLRKEWNKDTPEFICELASKYFNEVTVRLLCSVGENMPAAIRGDTAIAEHVIADDLLNDYYKNGLGIKRQRALLTGVVKQVTYRYPHAAILEIGSLSGGAGCAAADVISAHGGTVASYVYTNPSNDAVELEKEAFKSHQDKVSFKTLDLEQEPTSQGFQSQAFDVIIACESLRAYSSLETALEHARQLLRPGGYLIVLEDTKSQSIRHATIMGWLPDWWRRAKNDGSHAPSLTPVEWHGILRKTGFGGIDSISSHTVDIGVAWPFSVMVAEAVNEQVQFLRQPLAMSNAASVFVDNLVIMGTGSLESSRIAESVSERLRTFCGSIITLDSLPTAAEAMELQHGSTFLNLADLDAPILEAMTTNRMDSLKHIFEIARHVLWVTSGALSGTRPYHAASLAFCRSITHEASHVSFAALDILDGDFGASQVVAEQLLRQCALEEWEAVGLLWSREPETILRDGKLMIPRVLPSMEQNARLNSARRTISKSLPATSPEITIVSEPSSSLPRLVQDIQPPHTQEESKMVSVNYSSLMSVRITPDTLLHVAAGQSREMGSPVIALSSRNSKVIAPIVFISSPQATDSSQLVGAVTNELLAASVIRQLTPRSRLLVHCSSQSRFFASTLYRQAAVQDITVAFLHAGIADAEPSWISLERHESKQTLRRKLSHFRPTHYIDMSRGRPPPDVVVSDVNSVINQALPVVCRTIQISELADSQSSLPSFLDEETLFESLRQAVANAQTSLADTQCDTNKTISVAEIQDEPSDYSVTDIVRWGVDGYVTVQSRPLDGQQLLSQSKTYLLFGLTGQIGQSMCEWMVSNGAGCVCLLSRSPRVDNTWLKSFQNTESEVKTMAADITDIESLERALETIKSTCLPVGGLVNGANVLSDVPFSSMSADMMQQALRPKIDGSLNLDRAFYRDDLDFFVMLSSVSCVVGTAGQSNYAAANGFMDGLAKQRRSRGLAASALDLGLVLGIGLAEAAGQRIADSLQKYGTIPLSEPDLCFAFAESILTGYVSPKDMDPHNVPDAVLTSGLRTITTKETGIVWYNDPIFSHLVIDSSDVDYSDQSIGKTSKLTIREQIENSSTKEDVFEVLKDSLSAKLRLVLQSPELEIVHDTPLVELGIDSLVAVEVRSWFLKALKVDVPVLKVVGGSSLDEVCDLAMKRMPEEMLAHVDNATGGSEPTPLVQSPTRSKLSEATADLPSQLTPSKRPISHSSSISDRSSSGAQTPSSKETSISATVSVTGPLTVKVNIVPKPCDNTPELTEDVPGPMEGSNSVVKSEPISIGQSRFWFLQFLVDDPTTFNVALCLRITGTVRAAKLEEAFRVVTERHESLRTCFVGDADHADRATQRIMAKSLFRLKRKSADSVGQVTELYAELRRHTFDLASGPLLCILLVTLSPTSHYLLVNYHHIIMDMASFQVLTSDLDRVYSGKPLGPPPRQYSAFSMAQREAIANGEMNDDLQYWKQIFPTGEQPPVLSLLPMARTSSRPMMTDYAVHQVGIRLDAAIAARVRNVSKAQQSTPFHFYLAAFKSILFSFVEDQHVTIGIADANRHDSDTISSIGFFLNLLPLRFERKLQHTFASAIAEARNVAHSALEHSRLPFDVLLKELNVARSSTYSPFFQAFFDYRQPKSSGQTWLGCQLDLEDMHPGRTAYDITLDVADLGSEVHVTFRMQQGLYDSIAADLLLETYTHFVGILSQNVELTLEQTPRFSNKQMARAVQIGIGPDMTSGWPSTLPHRIDQMALQHPDSIALMDGVGGCLTYAAMMKRTEAIAEALVDKNIGAGSCVLVYQQAVADWVCSLLAIMRVGAVYVPLDIRNPIARLAAQAGHCAPAVVLGDATTVNDASQLHSPLVLDVSRIASCPTKSIPNSADPDALAAILYTSGSTGTPKGIMVRHSGLRNEMEGYTKTYSLGAERVLQQSAFTFDFSMDQIFTGLVNGGMLYIVPWDKRGDPISTTEIMREQNITYTKVTPSEYSMWIRYGRENLAHATSWRFAFAGGESLNSIVLGQFDSLGLPNLALHNSYGPAEISIASHKGLVDYNVQDAGCLSGENRRVPCGYSLPNYATYIMDENLNPLPAGLPGEVVIGGPGVSAGYLANQQLTSRAFLPNPYATPRQRANGWTLMHRTGDVGHMEEDGALVFRHRIQGDAQIKLRGLRIDLGDVESSIVTTAPGVLKEAIVTLREGDPDYLVAHVVFAPGHNITDEPAFLQSLLSRLPLPQYMVPVLAVPLPELPLNHHAKVDRKAIKNLALPSPAQTIEVIADDAPQMTETMVQLRLLWKEVLPNVQTLGLSITPSSSFFTVGGNSLLVVRLQSKIRETLNVAVRLIHLLNADTLENMARAIEDCPAIDVVDWDAETAPPASALFLEAITTSKKPSETEKVVLVTGATGNLARRVLPMLSTDERVSEIHCVVRNKSRAGEPFQSSKTVYHEGDLSLPLLGLDADKFHDLAQSVHVILHMGAVRSFWDNYHLLRHTNVQSTKDLVSLAATKRVPIHFISTSGVLPREALGSGVASSAAAFAPPADGSSGYAASKWASERLLERAAQGSLAVPSFIYRLVPSTGPALEPKQQVLDEFVRCIDEAGVLPVTTGWEGRLDLIPAKAVSELLCESVLESVASAQTMGHPASVAQLLHYQSTVSLDVAELTAHIEKQRGNKKLARMPILQWMGRMKAVAFSYVLASHDGTVKSAEGGVALATRR